jgi:DNA polymerase/3'-5' exonuclease PolX
MQNIEGGGSQTWMGIVKLPGNGQKARRMDIKTYPFSSFAFAVLYFTGSGMFNRAMRHHAIKTGWRLSDKGLFPCTRFGKQVYASASKKLYSEKEIFDALDLIYKDPQERTFAGVEKVWQIEAALKKKKGSSAAEQQQQPQPSDDDDDVEIDDRVLFEPWEKDIE